MSAEPIEQPRRPYRRPGTDPANCTRRWFSVDPSGCKCSRCLSMKRRMAKLRKHNLLPPSRSDEAWAAVERMLKNGWSIGAIAAAAGIDPAGLSVDRQRQIRKGGLRLGRVRAERLIGAETKMPPKGRVSALVARRQLQALAALGWSLRDLEPRTGMAWQTLHSIRGQLVEITDVRRVNAIDAVYRELCMTPGKCIQTQRNAEKRRWASPLAWEGHDMANPKAKATGFVPIAPKKKPRG